VQVLFHHPFFKDTKHRGIEKALTKNNGRRSNHFVQMTVVSASDGLFSNLELIIAPEFVWAHSHGKYGIHPHR